MSTPEPQMRPELLSYRLVFWLPAVSFILHFLEEMPQFAAWASARFAPTTALEFATVHIPLMMLVIYASFRAWSGPARTPWRFWATAFQWQFAFNAIFHLSLAAINREYVPGMVMAASVSLPATAAVAMSVKRFALIGGAQQIGAIVAGGAIAALAIGALFI